jgi:hypothetical protein
MPTIVNREGIIEDFGGSGGEDPVETNPEAEAELETKSEDATAKPENSPAAKPA